jgi:hypothetical protein
MHARITFKKTTRREFAVFKQSFLAWQKKLGLTDWRILFSHGHEGKDAYASICVNSPGRVAMVAMAKELEIETGALVGWNPRAAGRHEALELLLISMAEQIRIRKTPARDLQEFIKHAVIRRLEHVFDEEGMQ